MHTSRRHFSWCLVLWAASLSLTQAQLNAVLPKSVVEATIVQAQEVVERSTSPKDVMFASQLITRTGGKCTAACTALESMQRGARDPEAIYYSSAAVTNCGCSNRLAPEQVDKLRDALKESSLPSLAFGVLGSEFAGIDVAAPQVMTALNSLLEMDGRFKATANDKEGSSRNTLLAIDALALLAPKVRDTSAATTLTAIVDRASEALPGGAKEKESVPTVFASLSTVAGGTSSLRLGASRLLATAEALIDLMFSGNIEHTARGLPALELLQQYKTAPIYVQLKQSMVSANKPATVQVSVLTSYGAPADVEDVEVASITTASDRNSLLQSPVPMTTGANGEYTASLPSLAPGVYTVQFSVNMRNRQKRVPVDAALVAKTRFAIDQVSVAISESKTLDGVEMARITTQNSFKGGKASADAFEHIHVRFDVQSPRRPHQAFVRLTHSDSGFDTFFVGHLVASAQDRHTYTATLSLADEAESMQYRDGRYSLAVLVGDATAEKAAEWVIGSLEIDLPSKPRKEYPIYSRPLLHESDTTLTALPEIHHQFRPDAPRPPQVVSMFFTLLVALPVLGLIVRIIQLKPDFQRLNLYGVAFILCIGAVLALYAVYWFAIPLGTTLTYLLSLAIATFITGQLALSSINSTRKSTANAAALQRAPGQEPAASKAE